VGLIENSFALVTFRIESLVGRNMTVPSIIKFDSIRVLFIAAFANTVRFHGRRCNLRGVVSAGTFLATKQHAAKKNYLIDTASGHLTNPDVFSP
jgi:hypothetical protein